MNILKLKELRISYNENTTLMILEIESQNTSLSVNHVKKTRFREINDTMK